MPNLQKIRLRLNKKRISPTMRTAQCADHIHLSRVWLLLWFVLFEGQFVPMCFMNWRAVGACVSVKEVGNHHCHGSVELQTALLCGWCCGNDLKVWLNKRSTGECDWPSFCFCVLFGVYRLCIQWSVLLNNRSWVFLLYFYDCSLLKGKIGLPGCVWSSKVEQHDCPSLTEALLK